MIGWLEPLLAARGRKVAWLVGGQRKGPHRHAGAGGQRRGRAGGGHHAVIQEQVQFKNLALAIIDEQHRFGVAQRLALRQSWRRMGMEPHMLMMSATPIPRTLAMSYYADLDVSVIDELPPAHPIVTKLIADSRKDEVIERIGAQVEAGRQVYWVCPLIEESEALDLSNATATHADLSEALPGVMVGLLHSRMPTAEKKAVMALSSGQMGVLVSTTVIEVGVDVPNASLMVIEHAERFGLSQLHQLRGRVGRARRHRPACCCIPPTTAAAWAKPPRNACAPWPRPMTVSRSRGATWRFAAPASFWARASRAMRCCVLPIWPPTPTCSNGRANWPR